MKKITAKDWTFIGKYNHAAKWCRPLCSYYLDKENANSFKRTQKVSWWWYALIFIPIHILQAFVCLWDGGLKEFLVLGRDLGSDYLTSDTEAFKRAEFVWNKINKTEKDINN